MVRSLFNNCPIKTSAFRWFYNEENYYLNSKSFLGRHTIRHHFELDNGTISIQGGLGKYSKESNNFYTHFELGYPSFPIEEISEYAEDDGDLTNTVYPYVPFHVLISVLLKYKGEI